MSHGYIIEKASAVETLKSLLESAHELTLAARKSPIEESQPDVGIDKTIVSDEFISAFEAVTKAAIAENPDAAIKALMISTDPTKIYGRDIYSKHSAFLDAVDCVFLETLQNILRDERNIEKGGICKTDIVIHVAKIADIYPDKSDLSKFDNAGLASSLIKPIIIQCTKELHPADMQVLADELKGLIEDDGVVPVIKKAAVRTVLQRGINRLEACTK